MDLSIIIVHFNTPTLLNNCINSIINNHTSIQYEIIVVDNNSKFKNEKEISKLKSVKWINNNYNAGFSRGNNLGIKKAKGEYILLLNPDTEIKKGFLDQFVMSYKKIDANQKLGLLTCRIKSIKDNSLLVGSKVGFPSLKILFNENPIIIYIRRKLGISHSKNYNAYSKHNFDHEVDVVSGSCAMIKKSKLFDLDLFLDEDFFLYSEDVEWSFRIKKNKLKNYFLAKIEVFHVNSASTGNLNRLQSQKFASELLFYYKAYGKFSFYLIHFIIKLNIKLNIYLHRKNKLFDKLKIYELRKIELTEFSKIIRTQFSPFPSSSKHFLKLFDYE